jgi:hypothetical protein
MLANPQHRDAGCPTSGYQLDVAPDGRYVSDAPKPLWQLDGTLDLLTPVSPG